MNIVLLYIFWIVFFCCGYGFFGHVLWELHREAMETNSLCWLFWPDIDVKFIGKKFVNEHMSSRFIYWLWPFRLLKILLIFVARAAGLIIIFFVIVFLLVYDFVQKERISGNHRSLS